MRLFIAVPLDAGLRNAVAGLRPRLNSAAASFRWVVPENLHLTLKLLGEIAEERLAGVTSAAREVAGRSRPVSVTSSGMGAFPSPRRPQVVWVGVEGGGDRLIEMARHLDVMLRWVTFPKDRRAFRPHLTIARARGGGPVPDLSGPLGGLGGVMVG